MAGSSVMETAAGAEWAWAALLMTTAGGAAPSSASTVNGRHADNWIRGAVGAA